MIFADKLIELRKKNGWTQEELAERLDVSRQTISKWEGAQSVPDFKRMIQLSELFGVSTDYLLKDSLDTDILAPDKNEVMTVETGVSDTVYPVSMETADRFMQLRFLSAGKIAIGVFMCILSPLLLLAMSAFSDRFETGNGSGRAGGFLGSDLSLGIGVIVLLIMIAGAVALFIRQGMYLNEYDYISKQSIETEYGVSGVVKERRERDRSGHNTNMIIGIILCVLSPIWPIAGAFLYNDGVSPSGIEMATLGVCPLLISVAVGVMLIVRASIVWDTYNMLLEEGEYSRAEKMNNRRNEHIASIYWASAVALYLLISFTTMRWDRTWIIWPVAGVLYGVLEAVLKMVRRVPA